MLYGQLKACEQVAYRNDAEATRHAGLEHSPPWLWRLCMPRPTCSRVPCGSMIPALSAVVCAVTSTQHERTGRMWLIDEVEPVGIEPTTPCLQSRCSPS